MINEEMDQLSINTIRTLSMDVVQRAKSGHPGTPMELAHLPYKKGTYEDYLGGRGLQQTGQSCDGLALPRRRANGGLHPWGGEGIRFGTAA